MKPQELPYQIFLAIIWITWVSPCQAGRIHDAVATRDPTDMDSIYRIGALVVVAVLGFAASSL